MNTNDRAGGPHGAWIVVAVLTLGAAVPAAHASVSAVQGAVTNGQAITVTGSAFGSVGPNVVLFDDFERGTNGGFFSLTAPEIGSWTNQKNYPKYDNAYSRSGSLSLAISNNTPVDIGSVCGSPGGTYCDNSANWQSAQLHIIPAATSVFWAVWHFLPPSHGYPVESVGDINWKQTWVYGTAADWGQTGTNDWFLPSLNEQHHAEGYEYPSVGSNAGYGGANCELPSLYPLYYVRAREVGQWVRTSIHIGGSTNCGGTLQIWEIPFVTSSALGYGCVPTPTLGTGGDRNTCQMLRKQRSGITTQSEPWNGFSMNAYARTNSTATDHSYSRWDDMYLATGPGALARVEIANYPTWGDPAHGADMNMTICTPSSWSATSVTCTVRQGAFVAGQSAYLFVIDANGNVSDQDSATAGAQGFAVTIGSGGSSVPPPQVQNAERGDTKP